MNETTEQLPSSGDHGRRVGPYHLLQLLGRGGMGEVWLAEQKEPLRRKVAVKFVRTGLDRREVLARFEAERQALALMEHPYIARVFDAGIHEGAPYFVMEYVRGVPIHEYCDRSKLPIPDRLRLFQKVCEAVQHAHQKAIVHRDLKPSNILVTEQDGVPSPKIIDFGVAKAIAQPLTELTFHTHFGQLLGTPLYMSPEQADARSTEVDTRSDIYSLGVVLYELLTGSLPFTSEDLAAAGYEEMLRVLRERTPPRPSTRVSTLADRAEVVASARGRRLRTLRSELGGDLDWITMRCLEKDRHRRYEGAGALARDIGRHLALEPVEAGPPSPFYRLDRFVRRNRAAVAIGVILAGAVATTTVVSVVHSHRTSVQRDLALAAMARAEAAHLYTLGLQEEIPSRALAYAIASLELADQDHVRRLAMRSLQAGPTFHEFYVLPGAHNPWAAEFSPDGKWLAVGWSLQGAVRVFPVGGGEPIALDGHEGWVTTVRFTADSARLLTTARDTSLRVWSIPDGKLIRIVQGPPGDWSSFCLLDDQRTVILRTSDDGGPLHWLRHDLLTGTTEEVGTWYSNEPAHEWGESAVDPRGRWVVRGDGRRFRLIPLDDLDSEGPGLMGEHTDAWRAATFSPDGTLLVTTDVADEIRWWDVDGSWLRLRRVDRAPSPISAVQFDRGGHLLGVGVAGGGLLIFDDRDPVRASPTTLRHAVGQWGFVATTHPTLPWTCVTGTNGSVGAWQWDESRPVVLRAEGNAWHVAFDPDGEHLVFDAEGRIEVWPLDPSDSSGPRCVFDLPGANITSLALDRSGEWIVAGIGDGSVGGGTVVLTDIEGKSTRTWKDFTFASEVVISPDLLHVAALGDIAPDHWATRVWDLREGTAVDVGLELDVPVAPVGFLEDGRLLVRSENEVWFADVETAARTPFRSGIHAARLLADARTIVLTDTSRAWWTEDLLTGERTALPEFAPRRVCTDVDPRRGWMAVGHSDGSVEFGTFASPDRHLLLGEQGEVTDVALDPRGRWVAVADGTENVRLHPIPRGRPLQGVPWSELLAHLRSRTTLRAVPDTSTVHGYRITSGPFAGWLGGAPAIAAQR